MDTLAEIVSEEVRKYAGGGINVKPYPILDHERQIYAVNTVRFPERNRPANVMVLARVLGDLVIIEEDRTDRPLIDALLQAGIPRDQIILAYLGEAIPETEA
jgi:XisI protein